MIFWVHQVLSADTAQGNDLEKTLFPEISGTIFWGPPFEGLAYFGIFFCGNCHISRLWNCCGQVVEGLMLLNCLWRPKL